MTNESMTRYGLKNNHYTHRNARQNES